MKSLTTVLAGACLLLACATSALAVTGPGTNFDGRMSLIYNTLNGGVWVENSPHPNPSVQTLRIESDSGILLPDNIHLSVAPNLAFTPTPFVIEFTAPNNFLGTASFLGSILNDNMLQGSLEADLTIIYNRFGEFTETGDLIHGSFGQLQSQPVVPLTAPCCRFFNVASGQFFDPPMAYGYTYTMDSDSLFTKVGLPLGLGSSFTVSSSEGDESVGEGGQVEFTGVSSFSITGISPLVDPSDLDAFPVYLEFNTPTASFTMTPILVPEPSALALLALALCASLTCGRRRS